MRIIKDGDSKEYIVTCDNCKSDIVYMASDILEEERNSSWLCSYNEKYKCHTTLHDYPYIKCPRCLQKVGAYKTKEFINNKIQGVER